MPPETSPRAEPLYLQLLGQLRRAIAAGDVLTGETLPPIRTVMVVAGVGMQSVQHAYNLAAKEGLIARRRGMGMVVVASAHDHKGRIAALEQDAHRLVRHARELGLSRTDLDAAIRRAWASSAVACVTSGRTPQTTSAAKTRPAAKPKP